MAGTGVIDAHQHLWDLGRARYDWLTPEQAPIDRTIDWDELAPLMRATPISRTVLVQAADNAEDTSYMFEVAGAHPEVAGVVAWVPLDRPDDVADRLLDLRDRPGFAGVRNLIHDRPDPDWLLRPDVTHGLALLADARVPFDVVAVLPRHLEHVETLSERFPDLRMVIDHLAKPPIKGGAYEGGPGRWRRLMARAAANPNVYAKISGLYPASGDQRDWTPDDLRPYVDHAFEVFGADRLMFGSDWPVSVHAGGYLPVWTGLDTLFAELTPAERSAVTHDTAARFYDLTP
jgi:L-fuconolactonase